MTTIETALQSVYDSLTVLFGRLSDTDQERNFRLVRIQLMIGEARSRLGLGGPGLGADATIDRLLHLSAQVSGVDPFDNASIDAAFEAAESILDGLLTG